MKTPRVTDFDPNAKLPEDKVHELQSPLDGMPRIQKQPEKPPKLSPADKLTEPVL